MPRAELETGLLPLVSLFVKAPPRHSASRERQPVSTPPRLVPSNQYFFAVCGISFDQTAQIVSDGIVDKLKSLMNRASSGNGSIGRGNKVEILQPIMEEFG